MPSSAVRGSATAGAKHSDCIYSTPGEVFLSASDVWRCGSRGVKRFSDDLTSRIKAGHVPFPLKRHCMTVEGDVLPMMREFSSFQPALSHTAFEVWGYHDEHRALPFLFGEGAERGHPAAAAGGASDVQLPSDPACPAGPGAPAVAAASEAPAATSSVLSPQTPATAAPAAAAAAAATPEADSATPCPLPEADLLPGQVHPHTRRLAQFAGGFIALPSDKAAHQRFAAVTDFFTEDVRMRARRANEADCPAELWRTASVAGRTVARAVRKYGEISEFSLRHALFAHVAGCNVFKPEAAKAVFQLFGATAVLDMSAGWGDRLLGALGTADVTRYLAFDPNTSLRSGHSGMIGEFARATGKDTSGFEVRYEPFEDAELGQETFDVAFSSPPFFDLELYRSASAEDRQSSSDYPEFAVWRDRFLFAAMRKQWDALRPGGHCCIFINDILKHLICHDLLEFAATSLPGCVFVGVVGICAEAAPRVRPIWVWRKDSLASGHSEDGSTPQEVPHGPGRGANAYRLVEASPCAQRVNPWSGDAAPVHALQAVKRGSNPKMVLKDAAVNSPDPSKPSVSVTVIHDDELPGGTKQRALAAFMRFTEDKARRAGCPDSAKHEFVYAGPIQGFAQIALGVCAHATGTLGTSFIDRVAVRSRLTDFSEAVGSTVREVGLESEHAKLWQVEATAESYTKRRNLLAPGTCHLVPFGLDHPDFNRLLREAVLGALPDSLRAAPPRRLWLVAGSGTILKTLAEIWPSTYFLVVQVGKALPRTTMQRVPQFWAFKAPMAFESPAQEEEMPPFPSVTNYDAKLWGFVRRYAEPGDFVWNVGRDPPAPGSAAPTE